MTPFARFLAPLAAGALLVVACVSDTPSGNYCGADKKDCAGVCVSKDDPKTGCGTDVCTPCAAASNAASICKNGACSFACSTGFDDCDADPKNGCEANVSSDVAACGACKNACGAQNSSSPPRCEAGKCVFTCAANFAHCGADSGGCETDLRTSATNCGACGHSCDGGTCTNGKCNPVKLTTATAPTGIAIDATNVYYTLESSDAVLRIGKDGKCVPASPCPQTLAQGATPDVRGPRAIAVDKTNVYWSATAASRIGYLPVAGGNVSNFAGGTSIEAGGIALDGGKIFFVATFGTTRLRRANLDGSAITVMSTNNNAGRGNVVTDGTFVYWSNASNSVYRAGFTDASCDEGTTCKSVFNGSSPVGLAVDANTIYVTSPTGGDVRRGPKAGGLSNFVASSQDVPTPIVVDATYAYWGNVGTGNVTGSSIRRAPIAAGPCAGAQCELVVPNVTPAAMALDDKALYFVDSSPSGGIYKVVR